jgi:uncharacterized repeat protein (TIGR04052 family)
MRKLKIHLLGVMMLLILSAGMVSAHDEAEPVTIRFAAMVGNLPAACGITYNGLGTESSQVSLNDFRFYVSNVRLIDAEGEETAVELTQDGLWQYDNVALLDFEDGTAGCGEAGNPEMNSRIVGEVHEGDYVGVAFDLGIPFELNHLDTTTAPAPLNVPAMWWNWQYGYKFVRVDMLTPENELPAWFIHLGSTGCEAADGSSAPEEPCSNANVASVRFDTFNPATNFIVADLSQLLNGVNLTENAPEPPGCMSMSEDPDCTGLFPGFGLDLATGTVVEDNLQSFFHVGGETFEVAEMAAGEGMTDQGHGD